MSYLTGDRGISLQAVKFRTESVASKREEDRIKAIVIHKLERYLAIEEILNMSSVHWHNPPSAPYPVISDLLEVDRAASSLRNDWGLGINPIPDMAELMEDRGVKVLFCQLPGAVGLTAQVSGDNMPNAHVIVVTKRIPVIGNGLQYSHEIGHMVLGVSPSVDQERAAYRFAGAFLMPEEVLWSKIGKHRSDIDWKELLGLKMMYGMSVQAITYRCKDLGIISQASMGRLFDVFEEDGWRSPPYREPLDTLGDRFGRFERLCFRALAEGAISESKASELLEVSVSELDSVLERELSQ